MRLGKAICIAGLIGIGALGTALADDVTFNATGSFNDMTYDALDNAVLGGSLVIDNVNGIVEADGLNLTVSGGLAGSPGLVFDTLVDSGSVFNGTDNIYYIDAAVSGNPAPSLELDLNLGLNTDLVGFTGGSLCFVPSDFPTGFPEGNNCGFFYSSYELFSECQCTAQLPGDPQLTGGSMAPAAAPEPKSFLLLAGPAVWLLFRQRRKAMAVKIR
jgi:hypothetical protein